jgi:hypothetical protein
MTRPTPETSGPRQPEPDTFVIDPEVDTAAEALKERISTVLSAAAMLTMSGGVAWGLWPWLGPFAIAVGGLLLALFVGLADSARRPEPETIKRPGRRPVPGPSDPGNLHARGPGSTT